MTASSSFYLVILFFITRFISSSSFLLPYNVSTDKANNSYTIVGDRDPYYEDNYLIM